MVFQKGRFKGELKNRFLCTIEIDGADMECYVPSSCHISNFIEIQDKEVLVTRVASKTARTSYSLFAVPFKQSYIVLNQGIANKVIQNYLTSRRFSYLGSRNRIQREKKVLDYKSDFYIEDTHTIVEVKSLISTESSAFFPTVYSERTIRQLNKIKELLNNGCKICYIIVSLNPYVKEIKIQPDTLSGELIKQCKNHGMLLKGYSTRLIKNEISIIREIPILY